MGEFGAAPPAAPPRHPQTRPDPDPRRPAAGWEGRRPPRRLHGQWPEQSRPYLRRGPGRARSRSSSLSPLRLKPHGPPLRLPKPRPGHAPKSRPRLRRGPVGRRSNHKQNPRRPTRGGAPGSHDREGCPVGGTHGAGGLRGGAPAG